MDDVKTPDEEWIQGEDLIESHYSALTLHRKCPQAWYYRYDFGLSQPISGPAPELRFGSWWGALRSADALERGRKHDSLVTKPRKFHPLDRDSGPEFDQKTLTKADVFEAADNWWSQQDSLTIETWIERLGEELPARLAANDIRWIDRWESQTRYERPLGVEVFWKRPLPRPAGDANWEQNRQDGFANGMPKINLLGYIDQIYFDVQRNMVVVRDDKTMKGIPQQSSLDDMMDSQLQLYAWGVQPLLTTLGVGKVQAVAYDRVKSSAPTKPKLTMAGSLSASVTQFDLRTYLEFATEDTRPTEEIADWLTSAFPSSEVNPDTGEITHMDSVISASREQIDMVRNLPAGRFWGDVGVYYVSGARKGEPKFGVYEIDDSMVNKLKSPVWLSQFHQRTTVPVSLHVVRAHLRAAVDTATDIWRTQTRGRITGEAARNLSKENCTWCDYRSICRAQMVGGPVGIYDLREHNLVGRQGSLEVVRGE